MVDDSRLLVPNEGDHVKVIGLPARLELKGEHDDRIGLALEPVEGRPLGVAAADRLIAVDHEHGRAVKAVLRGLWSSVERVVRHLALTVEVIGEGVFPGVAFFAGLVPKTGNRP